MGGSRTELRMHQGWMEDALGMDGRCPGYGWKIPQIWMEDAPVQMEDAPGMDGQCPRYG